MAVDVTPLNILANGSGQPLVTSFSDTFNRSAPLGTNYAKAYWVPSPWAGSTVSIADYFIGAGGLGQCLNVNGNGPAVNPNQQFASGLFVLPTRTATNGKTQFVQATIVGRSGVTGDVCIACMVDDIAQSMYAWLVDVSTGNTAVIRVNNGGSTTLFSPTAASINDVMRLSADLSVPGQVTVTATRNGVSIGSSVDNSGARLTTGFSGGFYSPVMAGPNQAPLIQWNNFSCGIGL